MSYLFQGQRASEEVVLFTKQHPFILFRPFLISAGILLIPLVFYIFSNNNQILAILFVVCLVAAGAKGFLAWNGWKNSVLMLTNERVVFLHQKGLINREFVECNVPNIHQISHEVTGFLKTMFNYGNIHIFISGSSNPVIIPNIPSPYDIQQEILGSTTEKEDE